MRTRSGRWWCSCTGRASEAKTSTRCGGQASRRHWSNKISIGIWASCSFPRSAQRVPYWDPAQIVELIEHVSKRLSVNRERIYLTGYSMGGYGTWATACYEPDRFAAIVPLCGGGNVEQAERLRNLPIWAFRGDKDNVVPLEGEQAMVDVRQERWVAT